MSPSDFPQRNAVFGEGQAEYIPLPGYREPGLRGRVTTLWRATWRERVKFLFTGELWLQQLTFNLNLQPLIPAIDCPLKTEITHATIGSDQPCGCKQGARHTCCPNTPLDLLP